MSFKKTFDELLDAILADWRNQFPEADTSQGSLIFIRSACYASALWGLYNYQDWISRQIFPDTAESEHLVHHAWIRGLSRTYGETDAALLERLLDYIRRPPAGGNASDYEKWAKEVDNVADAVCLPLYLGLGTVGLIVLANKETTGSEVPDAELLAAVQAHIDFERPVGMKNFTLLPVVITKQDVTATVTGTHPDLDAITAAITAYMNALQPGQTLYLNQIVFAAIQAGADNIVISEPLADVTVSVDDAIRAGTINIQ